MVSQPSNNLMTELQERKAAIFHAARISERDLIGEYIRDITPSEKDLKQITATASLLINEIRSHPDFNRGFEALMAEYRLDTLEGVRLMTLTEALARIPDEKTKESLIRSKLRGVDWSNHIGKSVSPLVNSSARALLFTTSILDREDNSVPWLSELIRRVGEPAIRIALDIGMNMFGEHFVLGESLEEADKNIDKGELNYTYSYDMLGEAAITMEDSDKFYESYQRAIRHVGQSNHAAISLKLSALHPRYDILQPDRVEKELYPRLRDLVMLAREHDVAVTIDAEELDRLEVSLDLIERIVQEGICHGWDKFGLAVQSYAVRGMHVLRYLQTLATLHGTRLGVRLVKGAYWDAEIRQAQMQGVDEYPVFTRKSYTDVAFLACARFLLQNRDIFYPQFASHNVHSVATILHWVKKNPEPISFEFQRLHGMGQIMFDCILKRFPDVNCCIYAPIGKPKELLPYLIRRLLENTANSSFVNQLASNLPVEQLATYPAELAAVPAEEIPLPRELYMPGRINSAGTNLRYHENREELMEGVGMFRDGQWTALPFMGGQPYSRSRSVLDAHSGARDVFPPHLAGHRIGRVIDTPADMLADATAAARAAWESWVETPVADRCAIVRRFADLMESHRNELVALNGLEAGKTIQDSIPEIREAVDFCRYYAAQMSAYETPTTLPGPTGERNLLYHRGRGVFLCISPWNFPIAIYVGQIVAALVTGNTVVIKPAEQTSLIGYRLFQLLLEAGLPKDVAQFVPGDGEKLGPQLIPDDRISGVVFTGSFHTARIINKQLAARRGALTPLIAETGGQNVMITDSSALPLQVVRDAISSAFNSAGQRCSALRVLYVQDSSADTIIELLRGGIKELSVGDPLDLATDVGPVIDRGAHAALVEHIEELDKTAKLIARADRHRTCDLEGGLFILPCAYEIDSIKQLKDEHFGPILHVIRYRTEDIDKVIDEVNETGFALTFGIQSRNDEFIQEVSSRINAGNIYVNRNIIGAVVGTQPFGGFGMSGTGPKAGGPHYLQRFMVEVTQSINIAAVGGDYELLTREF